MEGRFVAYYRVSTDKQGDRGYGLEAQRKAVRDYLNGGDWKLVGEFTEVESGKRTDNRPELKRALVAAKKLRATLILAKLDRLARNVAFIAGLMERKVEFVCCDMPAGADLLIIEIIRFSLVVSTAPFHFPTICQVVERVQMT